MKLKNILNLSLLGCVLTITGVGCQIKKQHTTPIMDSRTHVGEAQPPGNDLNPAPPVNPTPGIDTTMPTQNPGPAIPPGPGHAGWGEDRATLAPQTVYFAFDKSAIRAKEQPKLDEVAGFLKSNADKAIRIEGNCDERGTEEYNRSLGDRRANSAREYLAHLGIDPNRIDTLSNGEDKPAVHGHNEAAWSKNRRDDFVVLAAPKP
jgi:peptidoglycan-associated lipoprotein